MMVKCVIKRDGSIVSYDEKKIADAIFAAAKSVGGNDYENCAKLAQEVTVLINEKFKTEYPSVEDIQNIVEKVLIENGHAKTAKEYILYRAARAKVREANFDLMKVFEDLTFKSSKDDPTKRENANINADTAMGTMLKYGSEASKWFYQNRVLSPASAEAHRNGDIHIHDLDFYTLTMTCCQIELDKILAGGFSTGHGHLREPNGIMTAGALAAIIIQSNQNDQHGGQSIPNFEYALSRYVKKTYSKKFKAALADIIEDAVGINDAEDIVSSIMEEYVVAPEMSDEDSKVNELISIVERTTCPETGNRLTGSRLKAQGWVIKARNRALKATDKETHQAMEAFVHNLNTMHSRAGAQTPFSSINYGTGTSPEERMIIKNILLATEEGLGHGETAIFPIHIFKVKEGVNYNPGDPNYDLFKLAIKVSAKRLFPNFSFIDAPFNLQYYKQGNPNTEIAYMGCRTRVIGNTYDPEREVVGGRGNLSFTSINLPRLAIKANGNIDVFWGELDNAMNIAINQLKERFEIQAAKKAKNFPFLMGQKVWLDSENLTEEDEVREVIKHGTLSVGFIGLAETLTSLIGKHHGESPEAQELGISIITAMREKMDAEAKATGLNWSLLATPAEGLSGRFVRIDRKKYGVIHGVTDKEYYTNSFHIPVGFDISAFEKIKLEAPYHALTNAGHISYVELDGDPLKNIDAFEQIIRCMKESGIGYGSINHPVDRCPICGYTGIIDNECPSCHSVEGEIHEKRIGEKVIRIPINFERIRRITGYLVGDMSHWNDAKRAEEHDRVKHSTAIESL